MDHIRTPRGRLPTVIPWKQEIRWRDFESLEGLNVRPITLDRCVSEAPSRLEAQTSLLPGPDRMTN